MARDDGYILLDVLISMLLMVIVVASVYSGFQLTSHAIVKQQDRIESVIATQNENAQVSKFVQTE